MTVSPVSRVEQIDVRFGPPEAGWIDFELTAGSQILKWHLSEVYDPFHVDFTEWLEAIVAHGRGRLDVDCEGVVGVLDVTPQTGDDVLVQAEQILEGRDDFAFLIDRKVFVSDFYRCLTAFWESPALTERWDEWILGLKDPDMRDDEYASVQTPWSVRSTAVEDYIGLSS